MKLFEHCQQAIHIHNRKGCGRALERPFSPARFSGIELLLECCTRDGKAFFPKQAFVVRNFVLVLEVSIFVPFLDDRPFAKAPKAP